MSTRKRARRLRGTATSALLEVTHADRMHVRVHLRYSSASIDGAAAQASEARKRQYYARPGHVSFDERRFKLDTLH